MKETNISNDIHIGLNDTHPELHPELNDIHPELQRAVKAINDPEVQEMIKRLGEHGLAVSLPHLHDEAGRFLPLPRDVVSFEAGLEVSFRKKDDPDVINGFPVSWRWDDELQQIAYCTGCTGAHCNFKT